MIFFKSAVLVTISTIRQLPQALALADSFTQFAPQSASKTPAVIIGLADNPANLPAALKTVYPIWPVSDLLPPEELTTLSHKYTPTEFAAACKPALIRDVFRRFPDIDKLVYADPNILFFSSLEPVWERLSSANVLLTPHITQAPVGNDWPDEKYFQNVGLYSADFLAFQRSAETDRMLTWWQSRVEERAFIDFCEGLCLDQLWLMHIPIFFQGVRVVKDLTWHVALWNLFQRTVRYESNRWQVNSEGMLFANMKGLYKPDEGLFPYQNRIDWAKRPDVNALISAYKTKLAPHLNVDAERTPPAYGQQREPVVLRGWKRTTINTMQRITQFIDRVPLPALK